MYARSRYEICRFDVDDQLYRIYLFETGEIAFTVTGNAIRLGLHTPDDVRWNWFWDLPERQETSRQVHTHASPVKVLRMIALRLAQYLAKHQPAFFFYTVQDNPRRQRLYQQLLARHVGTASCYEMQFDSGSGYVLFTHKGAALCPAH